MGKPLRVNTSSGQLDASNPPSTPQSDKSLPGGSPAKALKARTTEGVSPNSKTPPSRGTDGIDSRIRVDGSPASPGSVPLNVKLSPNEKRISGSAQESLAQAAAAPALSPQNNRTGAAGTAESMDTLSSEDIARNVGEGMLRYVLLFRTTNSVGIEDTCDETRDV